MYMQIHEKNDLHCGSCGRLLYSVPSPYAITQQQRKNILRYVHHSSERFELPYILLTCTSSSRTKSLEYFIVEIFLYIKIYTCVVCVCA